MPRRSVFFITHAEVTIDPAVPIPEWGLSDTGKRRHRAFNRLGPIGGITAIYSSGERKAQDGAGILAAAVGMRSRVVEALHENDRSATGYLPREEFEAVANAFFASPDRSIRGWETARDAQTRIVAAVGTILREDPTRGDIAIVAHGGVGTLLLCHLMGCPIARAHDQPGAGGGNFFAFDRDSWALLHGWRDIAGGAPD